MSQQVSRFVRLCYIAEPHGDPKDGIPFFVIGDDQGLHVAIRPGWDRGLPASDREYLSALMADWNNVAVGEVDSTLDQLSEVSIGPLRAVESGILDESRRGDLIRKIEADMAEHGS